MIAPGKLEGYALKVKSGLSKSTDEGGPNGSPRNPRVWKLKRSSVMKRLIKILERCADEWLKDDDWWYGLDDCDINVYYNGNGSYSVDIYGLTPISDDLYETNTSDLKDSFTIKGVL